MARTAYSMPYTDTTLASHGLPHPLLLSAVGPASPAHGQAQVEPPGVRQHSANSHLHCASTTHLLRLNGTTVVAWQQGTCQQEKQLVPLK